MPEYFACGDKRMRYVPACKNCFEIWGDLFPNNSGLECEIQDIDTDLDEEMTHNWDFLRSLGIRDAVK